jgi:hypothetical protein
MKKKTESKAKIHASRLSGGALREDTYYIDIDIDGGDHIRVNMDARQFAEMLTSKQTKVVVEVTR